MTTTKYETLKQEAKGKVCARCGTEPRIANINGIHALRCECHPDGPTLVTKASHESKALARQYDENRVAANPEVRELSIRALMDLYPEANETEMRVFQAMCIGENANPFLGEAYFAKVNGRPVYMRGYKVLIKRASQLDAYRGFESGVLVETDNGIEELDGSFYHAGKLVGGWARVYRSDRDRPAIERVRLEDWAKPQRKPDAKPTMWDERPAWAIEKVAVAHAHAKAFPDAGEAMREQVELAPAAPHVVDVPLDKAQLAPPSDGPTDDAYTEADHDTRDLFGEA